MNIPDIAHGKEHIGVVNLAPDITEQAEIARRIDFLVTNLDSSNIPPSQRVRTFKDYRSPQPVGVARISAAYSDEHEGRFSSEIHAFHTHSNTQAHYSLMRDGEAWLRTTSAPNTLQQHTFLDHDDMVHDLLEYAPDNGAVAELLDKAACARAITKALFIDMNPSAHYKLGTDHYRTSSCILTADGYASSRQIELLNGQENKNIQRKLTVSALVNIALGPVDITQTLGYEIKYKKDGSIQQDRVQLSHASKDGLSPQVLENLATQSDIVHKRIDILHDALNILSEDTLLQQS